MLGLGVGFYRLGGNNYVPSDWKPSNTDNARFLKLWHRKGLDYVPHPYSYSNLSQSQWDDSSGEDNHAIQNTSGNQAALTTGGSGGLHFDGVDDYYEYSTEITISSGEAYTLALVYKLDTSGSGTKHTVFSKDANSTFFEFFSDSQLRINYAGSPITLGSGTYTHGTVRTLIVTRDASGAHSVYNDGSDTAVTTGTQDGVAVWQNLGIRNDNDRPFDGQMFEVIVYDGVEFTGTELTDLNTYLTGLANSI
tara:strand:- start:1005 stop:1754 length:750 start_codon:yes stop_codon:yes gene_type:complete